MNYTVTKIRNELMEMQDSEYQHFNSRLIPTVSSELILGVRTPNLRKYSKELFKTPDKDIFLNSLPHKYFEENNLHSYLIAQIKDFNECIVQTEKFLPYIDNWATCDASAPKIFAKHKTELLDYIKIWIKSNHTYTVRYAICLLMRFFLDKDFDVAFLDMVASVKSDEYYINMMIAWYFATALAKQYDYAIKYIEQKKIPQQAYNKTIQKAVESYRISDENKAYLKTLKYKQ